jgi:hypothetical protein
MKRAAILLGAMAAIALGWYLWDLKGDRSKSVKILKPTQLYSDWESINGSKTIGSVAPGEHLKVLRIRYAKDHMAIKVEKADGSSGWLIPDDSVEIDQK